VVVWVAVDVVPGVALLAGVAVRIGVAVRVGVRVAVAVPVLVLVAVAVAGAVGVGVRVGPVGRKHTKAETLVVRTSSVAATWWRTPACRPSMSAHVHD
jgi:hypothetical protein